MKTLISFFAITVLFLFIGKNTTAQTNGLSVKLTKTAGSIYTSNNNGKHLLSFEISGIESQKHADNLIKFIRGYRGVEEFNMLPISGSNKWQANGIFYEYSDIPYFKNLFKIIKVTEAIQDNITTSIDKL